MMREFTDRVPEHPRSPLREAGCWLALGMGMIATYGPAIAIALQWWRE